MTEESLKTHSSLKGINSNSRKTTVGTSVRGIDLLETEIIGEIEIIVIEIRDLLQGTKVMLKKRIDDQEVVQEVDLGIAIDHRIEEVSKHGMRMNSKVGAQMISIIIDIRSPGIGTMVVGMTVRLPQMLILGTRDPISELMIESALRQTIDRDLIILTLKGTIER